jgi:predicted enzyme related to lactoylglutathione lyase
VSVDVKTTVGKFVWHENVSNDRGKAAGFYKELLGWEIEVWKPGEMDYPMIKAGDQMHGGFGTAEGGAPSHWFGHVLVEDVDETARKAEAAGGKILAGPMDIPEIGRFAVIADPQGAVTSAFAPAGEAPNPEGTFVWDELMTTDVEGAKSFYGEVFGWTTREMEMGEEGTYTLFLRGGETETAGTMARPEGAEAPPHWVSYVGTSDVDGTAARAKELGGTVLVEAMDIPGNIGRFAIVQDPVGAVFGLFKGNETT